MSAEILPENGIVLVTGAGGFVGGHLLRELKERKFRLRATDLPGPAAQRCSALDVEFVPSDITDPSSLDRAVTGVDAVIHVAAIMNYSIPYRRLRAVNVEGVRNVCKASVRANVKKFLYFSSAEVYGFPEEIPATEKCPKLPVNQYGRSKWEGELIAWKIHREEGLPVTVLRPSAIYGIGSVWGVITPVVLMYKHILFFYPGPRHIRANVVHVDDVAGSAAFLIEHPDTVGEAFNIADDSKHSFGEVLSYAATKIGVRLLPMSFPYPFMYTGALISEKLARLTGTDPILNRDMLGTFFHHHVYDCSKIKGLGYRIRKPELFDGFEEVLQWYLSRNVFRRINPFHQGMVWDIVGE
jgi:nucleoside-diphosphate-sugar epimerase